MDLRAAFELGQQEARALLVKAGKMQALSLDEIRQFKPEPDWGVLDKLYQLYIADIPAATRSVQLLSPSEVLSRFGQPNSVRGGSGMMVWSYADDGQRKFEFIFQDGFVVKLVVR